MDFLAEVGVSHGIRDWNNWGGREEMERHFREVKTQEQKYGDGNNSITNWNTCPWNVFL